jgi:hypothetical protein
VVAVVGALAAGRFANLAPETVISSGGTAVVAVPVERAEAAAGPAVRVAARSRSS